MAIRYQSYARPRLDLGQAFIEAATSPSRFIGTRALRVFRSPVKSGTFSKINRESLLRDRAVLRASGANYNRDVFEAEDDTFTCKEYGFEVPLGDDERALYASDFDAERAAMMLAADVLLMQQERRIATALFNTTTWTGAALTTDVSAQPWDTASSPVVDHVIDAKDKVRQLTGMMPNALIIGQAQFNNLFKNDDLIGRLQNTVIPTIDQLQSYMARIFGVDMILVGAAVRNSASEDGTFVAADVWSATYAMVAVVATGDSMSTPCLGRTVLWTPDSPENATVEEYRDEPTRSTIFRVRQTTHEKVIDASFAHLLKID